MKNKYFNYYTMDTIFGLFMINTILIPIIILGRIIFWGSFVIFCFLLLFNVMGYVAFIRDLDRMKFKEWKNKTLYNIDWKEVQKDGHQ